jgi:hypothetical protein
MYIIIDYLLDSDYRSLGFKAVEKSLEKFTVTKCENPADIKKTIIEYGQLNDDTIITIFSHGHERGLAKGTWESLITWCELLELINRCKGNHKITLNLLSVCNSNSIQISANFFNHKIDEIWVTTSEVVSISKSLLALNASSFDDFRGQLEDDEIGLYENIVF